MAKALKKFARNKNKEEVTVITARLENSKHERFKAYCDELGLSINEAINLLIDIELDDSEENQENNNQKIIDDEDENKSENDSKIDNKNNNVIIDEINKSLIQTKITNSVESDSEDNSKNDSGDIPKNDSPKNSPKNKTSNKRFTVKPFEILNEIPCPICETWQNKSNFARHAKDKHNASTEEIYTQYKDKVQEMFEAKTAELEAK